MAPPNRYTNSSISMIGSIREVSSASSCRLDSRTQRPARANSDMDILPGAGQGEEDVVEGGAVDGEPLDDGPPGVDLVEQGPYVARAPVGGHADPPPPRVALQDPVSQARR